MTRTILDDEDDDNDDYEGNLGGGAKAREMLIMMTQKRKGKVSNQVYCRAPFDLTT